MKSYKQKGRKHPEIQAGFGGGEQKPIWALKKMPSRSKLIFFSVRLLLLQMWKLLQVIFVYILLSHLPQAYTIFLKTSWKKIIQSFCIFKSGWHIVFINFQIAGEVTNGVIWELQCICPVVLTIHTNAWIAQKQKFKELNLLKK